VLRPEAAACHVEGNLACHGYGSTVTVTATFGMVAASLAVEALLGQLHPQPG
jgi:tRNA A37 threonylcarbamoyladenosine dehydratase